MEYYLAMEQKARIKWRKQMAELEALEAPVVRLAETGSGVRVGRLPKDGQGHVVNSKEDGLKKS